MPGLKHFVLEGHCYHTTSVTRGREPIFTNPVNARLLLEAIQFVRETGAAYVLAYAIMPDHVHLLFVPRTDATVSSVMKSIKGFTVKRINQITQRKGSLWQQGFYDRVIRDEAQPRLTIEYIHRNPVVAGLVRDIREYEFSSAHPEAKTDLETFFAE